MVVFDAVQLVNYSNQKKNIKQYFEGYTEKLNHHIYYSDRFKFN